MRPTGTSGAHSQAPCPLADIYNVNEGRTGQNFFPSSLVRRALSLFRTDPLPTTHHDQFLSGVIYIAFLKISYRPRG